MQWDGSTYTAPELESTLRKMCLKAKLPIDYNWLEQQGITLSDEAMTVKEIETKYSALKIVHLRGLWQKEYDQSCAFDLQEMVLAFNGCTCNFSNCVWSTTE